MSKFQRNEQNGVGVWWVNRIRFDPLLHTPMCVCVCDYLNIVDDDSVSVHNIDLQNINLLTNKEDLGKTLSFIFCQRFCVGLETRFRNTYLELLLFSFLLCLRLQKSMS